MWERFGIHKISRAIRPSTWRHNGRDGVSNHQSYHRLLNRLIRRRSKETSKVRDTGLCVCGNSLVTSEFLAQMASNAENVSNWSRYHAFWITHWARVTLICKLTIIGSDNGLSPGQHQAIIWTCAGIELIRTLGTNFSEILSDIHTYSFEDMYLKMSAKWQTICLGLIVLILFCQASRYMLFIAKKLSKKLCTRYMRCFLGNSARVGGVLICRYVKYVLDNSNFSINDTNNISSRIGNY